MGKLFTLGRCLIAVIVIIVGMYFWAGAETVMTRWGFETKTTLIKKLRDAENAKQAAIDANKTNVVALQKLQKQHADLLVELQVIAKKKAEADEFVKQVMEVRQIQQKKAREVLVKKTVVTATEITIPIAEWDQLSASNADAAKSVYDQFFTKESSNDPSQPLSGQLDRPDPSVGLQHAADPSRDENGNRRSAGAGEPNAEAQAVPAPDPGIRFEHSAVRPGDPLGDVLRVPPEGSQSV